MTQQHTQSLGIILLLAFLAAVGPFAIDTYLPSLPDIAKDFDVSSAIVGYSLGSFFAGLAAGQLISGPLSDRYGRKPVLLVGFILFLVATVACALAPTVEFLVAARLFQGLAASASPAAGRAVVRDLWEGNQAARAMAYVAMAMTIAPLLAPSLGSVILYFADWRMIFWALVVFSAIAILLILFYLPETNRPEHRQGGSLWAYFRAYGNVLSHPVTWAYLLCGGLSTATMFAYIAGSPAVYIEIFGVSAHYYGILFGLNVVGLFAGNWINSVLVMRYGYHSLLMVGAIITLVGTSFLLLGAYQQWHSIYTLVIGLFVAIAPVSFVGSNSNVGLLNLFPNNAGASNAVFGVAQFGLGAGAAFLIGVLFQDTELAMSQVMWLTAIGSFAATLWLLWSKEVTFGE